VREKILFDLRATDLWDVKDLKRGLLWQRAPLCRQVRKGRVTVRLIPLFLSHTQTLC
jgi:hypothetical protein